jgi:hypothetical protein
MWCRQDARKGYIISLPACFSGGHREASFILSGRIWEVLSALGLLCIHYTDLLLGLFFDTGDGGDMIL